MHKNCEFDYVCTECDIDRLLFTTLTEKSSLLIAFFLSLIVASCETLETSQQYNAFV